MAGGIITIKEHIEGDSASFRNILYWSDDGTPAGNLTPLAHADATPIVVSGTAYADQSITSLSAGQAAGTANVLNSNSGRKALMVNPPADCILAIASGATKGWPLFGGVPNTISGVECPTNALYLVGLAVGAAVTMWEA